MAPLVDVVTISGATFISVGGHPLPAQSFIGDWEGHQWGDGKFSGVASVAAVATLRLGATLTDDGALRSTLTAAADHLAGTLAIQIEAFTLALKGAAKATPP
jgi:hypothetical protein